MKLLHYLIRLLFIVGLALLVFFAFPGNKGIVFAILTMGLGAGAVFYFRKPNTSTHPPLLLDFLFIVVMMAPFFMKDVPAKIYPSLICWLISSILDVVYWFLDRQYEGRSFKQLFSLNFRLLYSIDLVLLMNSVPKLFNNELTSKSIWHFLIVAFALVDFCRQSLMVKNGTLKMKDLF